MKALMFVALVFFAGCAQHSGFRLNDGRWGDYNKKMQEACVLKIMEIAPPTATAEQLDYNLQRCLMVNGVFI